MISKSLRKIILPSYETEVERGIVVGGANGTGKTRLGIWVEIFSSQKK